MANAKHTYVLANAARAPELARLKRIDEYMGPTTERRIERLGIGQGWKCLDVGAGAGGVARWMAERTGRDGRVVATDLDPILAQDPELPQLEIRRHDILQKGMETDFYDLVHCRLLLVNVGNVALALERMIYALRPGGWLIVEEPGESRLPGVGDADPRVAEYNCLTEEFLAAVAEHAKAVDLSLYRRLPGLLEAAGLVSIGGEVSNTVVGTAGRGAVVGTIEGMRPLLAETSFVKDGRVNRLLALCADSTLLTLGGSTLCLWGRRP
jgi:SAM-dependent methyltransferase